MRLEIFMKKKILVIDDEPIILCLLTEMLLEENFEVQGAENGWIGLQKIREYFPDLIICDIEMPVMNGYEVLSEIRKNETMATIPFIFLSGKSQKVDFRRGMELGADDYLTKPIRLKELIASVNKQIEKRDIFLRLPQQKVDKMRHYLTRILPHELRTPLTCILGFSELLIDTSQLDAEEISHISHRIYKNASKLSRLIENYLLLAEIDMENARVSFPQNFTENPGQIIKAQAVSHAEQYNRKADLELDIEDVSKIYISSNYMKKIVEEICDNAFKFSHERTKVHVSAKTKNNEYIVQISDHGRGMSSEEIDGIGAYVQFNRNIHEQQGAGLGLAIAKRLVQLHEGQFGIESVPSSHTKVHISFSMIPKCK